MRYLNSHRFRNTLIFLIFAGSFFIVTPFVLAYASGYRFHIKTMRFEKTGLLIISSTPTRAKVSIDDKQQRSVTPMRVRNLFSGEYTVTISHDSSTTWTKKIRINSGETTFIDRVVLFQRNVTRESFSPITTGEVWVGPNRTHGIITSEEVWQIWDARQQLLRAEGSLASPISTITWSPSNNYALALHETEDIAYIFDLEKYTMTIMRDSYLATNAHAITDQGEVLIRRGESITRLTGDQELPVSHYNLMAAQRWQNNWLVITDSLPPNLEWRTAQGALSTSVNLPEGTWEILDVKNEYVLVRNTVNFDTLIFDSRLQLLHEVREVKYITWSQPTSLFSPRRRELLLASNTELALFGYNRFSGRYDISILLRVTDPFSDVTWHPTGDAVLFIQNNTLKAIETDTKSGTQMWDIATWQTDYAGLLTNTTGTKIYTFERKEGRMTPIGMTIFARNSLLR